MGRDDMADSFHVGVGDVPPVPGLGPDQGWVGMTVQFLVDAMGAGAEHVVFGRAVFAPGHSEHQWHRHPGAEEFVFIPRRDCKAEDDGWLATMVHDVARSTSALHIYRADTLDGEPVARVAMPCRVPAGFHAKWVPSRAG